ncbi:hypothetical protein C5167_015509 [Papaver somniferum]|uniref:Uncharacterized protein n=1 Tax=Papaver somniferum TaxID=3469 RepID=A0A4Y7J775_PAPSO|nr:protein trichome birefringence-like 2 [Papaver somniferum]RZC56667.1 hypothetical protein C5167_015509 [Papaver somniferum]
MKKLGIWEKLCHMVGKLSPHHGANNNASSSTTILRAGSKRKGSLVLIGFGFVLGASVLILTIFFSMFPSVMNPMLENNLAKVDRQIPLLFDSSSSTTTAVTSTFSSDPLQENTSPANQTISSSSNASQENLDNSSQEVLKNSTASNQTIVSSSSPELWRDFIPTNQTESSSTFTNYSSSVVSGSVPKVEELVIADDETNAVTATSNIPSNRTGTYNEKQEIVNAIFSHSRHDCNIFEGEWVKPANDNIREPFYPPGSCPYIDRKPFNCFSNGRPDDAFLKLQWHWQSHPTNAGCKTNFPSLLNASDFLERLRGKKVVFAGDSLNRNMFESLICILWNAVPDKSRVHWLPGSIDYKIRGDRSLKYEDYNCTVGFVWSPYLVFETNPPNRRNKLNMNEPVTMRLDMIDERASSFYRDADLVIFDSWHWWIKDKTNNGINYFQEGDYLHPKMEMSKAYKKGLTTWRKWMDKNIDPNKTQVVFRGYSVNHFRGGKWNTGGKCNRETEPTMSNETFVEKNPSQVKLLEDTIRKMKIPVIYLNVTKLTYYRTDGHPSIYANYMATYEERIAAALTHQDCSHWCLPGIPDTWNELLYISLMRAGKGSFAR